MQQIHSHASLQAVLEPKLDVVAKLVALRNPAELDEIRADRLKFWAQMAEHLQSERLSWLQGAPEALRLLLAQIHGPHLSELAVVCGQDRGLAIGLPLVWGFANLRGGEEGRGEEGRGGKGRGEGGGGGEEGEGEGRGGSSGPVL